ncbi:MAG: AI-2E family transporter [Ruminococcaceae bacterium]|nr:AI-2E family transporter [Oscillospiraceae bacterium]
MQKKIDFSYWAAVSVCLCALFLLLRFLALPLLSAALPFLLSAVLVSIISPIAGKIANFLHWKKTLCTVLLFLISLALFLLLGGFALAVLIREGRALLSGWLADLGSPTSLLSNAIDALRLPAGEESELFRAQLKTMLTDFAVRLFGEIAEQLPGIAAKIASGIPSVILFAVVTVFSGVYFSANGERIWKNLTIRFPKWQNIVSHAPKEKAGAFLQKFVSAYLLLFLISFAVLLIGFWILNPRYAFLAALLIALVDLLPFFGTGTVLIPWAILELLTQNYFLGFGLLILCLVATLARQIAEPHLVGKTLGVHPLLSLAAGYAGWKFAGVAGLLLAPLLLPVVRWILPLFVSKSNKSV